MSKDSRRDFSDLIPDNVRNKPTIHRRVGEGIEIGFDEIERLEVSQRNGNTDSENNYLPYIVLGAIAIIAIIASSGGDSGSSCEGSELMCNWASNLFD